MQEALVDAWKAKDSFRDGTDREAWITTLCLNRCRMRLRSRKREREALGTLAREPEPSPPPFSSLEGAEAEEAFRKALSTLPEMEREAFLLIAVQELGSERAGHILGCSAASARSYLARARKALMHSISI